MNNNQYAHATPWSRVVKDLSHTQGIKYNLGAILRDCRPQHITVKDQHLTLRFRNPANLNRINEELANPAAQEMLRHAIRAHFGEDATFHLTSINSASLTDPGTPTYQTMKEAA